MDESDYEYGGVFTQENPKKKKAKKRASGSSSKANGITPDGIPFWLPGSGVKKKKKKEKSAAG